MQLETGTAVGFDVFSRREGDLFGFPRVTLGVVSDATTLRYSPAQRFDSGFIWKLIVASGQGLNI